MANSVENVPNHLIENVHNEVRSAKRNLPISANSPFAASTKRSRSNSAGTPSFSSPTASVFGDLSVHSPRNGRMSSSSFIYVEGEDSLDSIPEIYSRTSDFPAGNNALQNFKDFSTREIFFSVGTDTHFEPSGNSVNKAENPQPNPYTSATPSLANMRI